jgi:hypothetical protein
MVGGGGGAVNGADVVLQVAALPILYVVSYVTTAGVLHAQPVSHAGYSNVHPRHVGRCNDVSTEFYVHRSRGSCLTFMACGAHNKFLKAQRRPALPLALEKSRFVVNSDTSFTPAPQINATSKISYIILFTCNIYIGAVVWPVSLCCCVWVS